MRICALLIMLLAGTGALAAKPNIVFYFIDDLGWTDVSFMGSKYYETPHVDRLAKEGMVFMDAYACAPNCAPSRACLMSGLYGPRHGVFTVSNSDRGQSSFASWYRSRTTRCWPIALRLLLRYCRKRICDGHHGQMAFG